MTEPDPVTALAAQPPPARRCPKCGEIKPLTTDWWYRNRRNADGFDSWCKTCSRARTSERCKTSRPTARVNDGQCLCRECGEWKPLTSEFWYADKRSSRGYRIKRCIQCEGKYHARCRRRNLVLYMLANARRRAKKSGVPFRLTCDDIVIPKACPILGIPLEIGDGRAGPRSPSLDRIKPELGYVPENIQVISARANVMKNDAAPSELLAFADWAYKTYGQADRDESAT